MPARQKPPVERIRQLLSQGVQQSVICTRLGVSKSVVSKIATGKYKATT